MKLNKKLFCFVTPATLVAVSTPITLSACNNNIYNKVNFFGNKTVNCSGATKTFEHHFELNKSLQGDQTINLSISIKETHGIVVTPDETQFKPEFMDFDVGFTINGTESGNVKFDLKFSGINSSLQEVWSNTITGFEVIYTK